MQTNLFEARAARDAEVWVPVPVDEFKHLYHINQFGVVKRIERKTCENSQVRNDRKKIIPEQIIRPRLRVGYWAVLLSNKGYRKDFNIHRLIALAFIPNPNNLPFINHINGIKTDNRIENLEWTTPEGNMQHAYKIGLAPVGEKHPKSKFTEKDVVKMFELRMRGTSAKQIASQFNVHPNAICHILNGKNWKHLTERRNLTKEMFKGVPIRRKQREKKEWNLTARKCVVCGKERQMHPSALNRSSPDNYRCRDCYKSKSKAA